MTDLRTLERDSIRAFVKQAADDGYLSGRVLDYGCGKQPYRGIVEAAGGEYVGFDRADYPANVSGEDLGEGWTEGMPYDAVLCTQVIQYVPDPGYWLKEMRWLAPSTSLKRGSVLRRGGHLVLTYPTNWPEVEPEDLWRFTKAGMERLLGAAGFEIVRHERRGELVNRDGRWALGYGVVARA